MARNPETITTCGDHILVAKTCLKCHELKDASQFYRRNPNGKGKRTKAVYEPWCKPCVAVKTRECNRKSNAESLEKATRYREVWTQDHIDTLVRLTNLGLSTRDIAERLGRTIDGVYTRQALLRTQGVLDAGNTRLFYYESSTDSVRQVGAAFDPRRKGSIARLHRFAQELAELHTQLIFFIEVDGGGEYMGIRGLDALKEGDDREPEDTSEDKEHAAPAPVIDEL